MRLPSKLKLREMELHDKFYGYTTSERDPEYYEPIALREDAPDEAKKAFEEWKKVIALYHEEVRKEEEEWGGMDW